MNKNINYHKKLKPARCHHLFENECLLNPAALPCIEICFKKQNKTKQNKTKQNKTKQNKIKNNVTLHLLHLTSGSTSFLWGHWGGKIYFWGEKNPRNCWKWLIFAIFLFEQGRGGAELPIKLLHSELTKCSNNSYREVLPLITLQDHEFSDLICWQFIIQTLWSAFSIEKGIFTCPEAFYVLHSWKWTTYCNDRGLLTNSHIDGLKVKYLPGYTSVSFQSHTSQQEVQPAWCSFLLKLTL